MLSKYNIEILNILKQDQALDKNNVKIILEIKKDKNTIDTKNVKTLLFINSTLIEYKTQRAR